jgi:hypothetical protein
LQRLAASFDQIIVGVMEGRSPRMSVTQSPR